MIKESDFGKVLQKYAKTCEYISKEVGLMYVPTFLSSLVLNLEVISNFQVAIILMCNKFISSG